MNETGSDRLLVTALLNQSVLTIENNKLEAYLSLCTPPRGYEYTIDEVLHYLASHKVTYGVNREVLEKMVTGHVYETRMLVAQGKDKVAGKDGFFEFTFDTNQEYKPEILEDGSVNYHTAGVVTICKSGDLLARYTPPTEGKYGATVTGELLKTKRGRNLRKLRTSNVTMNEDATEYYAEVDGKPEYAGGKLIIRKVFEVNGDLDFIIGLVDYDGEVIIHGNMLQGTVIRASGNVTVNGTAGPAEIYSGGNVCITNGMQGAGVGKIRCDGKLSGKFFELADLSVKADLEADWLLSCTVHCSGSILLSGKRGSIIGGSARVQNGIAARNLGTPKESETVIEIGPEYDLTAAVEGLQQQIAEKNDRLAALGRLFVELSVKRSDHNDSMKEDLLDEKFYLEEKVKRLNDEVLQLISIIENPSNLSAKATGAIYPGVIIKITGTTMRVNDTFENCSVQKRGSRLVMQRNAPERRR